MKVLLSSILLIHIGSVLSVYIPMQLHPNAKSEIGNVKLEPLENIFSNHIPQFLEPLNLTTGELKLFTGHSFQLLKSKCPAVPQDRLALINKYITKLISKTNPVPGSSATFKELIASMSTCTQHQMTEEEKAQREMSFFQFFFHPLRSFRHLFGLDSATPTVDSYDDEVTESLSLMELSSTVAPASAPDTLPLDAKAESVQVMNLKEGNKATPTLSKDDDDNEDFVQFASPSSTVSPDTLSQEKSDDKSQVSPFIRIFWSPDGDDIPSPYSPITWLGSLFQNIRTMLSGMFASETVAVGNDEEASESDAIPTSTPAAASRAKRSADATMAPTQPSELIEIQPAEANPAPMTVVSASPKDAPSAPRLKGREAFMVLVDNLCRIYCAECMDQEQIRNFKAAAKELYQLILTDSTGIELAAKHFLEPEFLQSLNEC